MMFNNFMAKDEKILAVYQSKKNKDVYMLCVYYTVPIERFKKIGVEVTDEIGAIEEYIKKFCIR